MANITRFIEGKLKLQVNREKSKVAIVSKVKFLGMTIVAGALVISVAAMQGAMKKVKELTPRGTAQTMEQSIGRFNQWYTGWANYYQMTYYPAQLKKIEAHARRRFRARLVDQQKHRRNLCAKLKKMRVSGKSAA